MLPKQASGKLPFGPYSQLKELQLQYARFASYNRPGKSHKEPNGDISGTPG